MNYIKSSTEYSNVSYRFGELERIFRHGLSSRPMEVTSSFEADYPSSGEDLQRVGFLLGALLMMAFSYWDAIVDSSSLATTAALRFGIIAPLLILVAWKWNGLPIPVRGRSWCAMLVSTIGLNAIYFIQQGGFEFSITGNMMLLLFVFVFMRYLFREVVALSAAIVGIYFLFGVIKVGVSDPLLHIHMMVMISTSVMGLLAVYGMQQNAQRVHSLTIDLAAAKAQVETMLHEMIPERLASRIIAGERSIAEPLNNATFMFVDIVGFTKISQTLAPHYLVEILNEFFSGFDEVASRYGWEKIKTIGDGYMAINQISGPEHGGAVVNTCIDMFAVAAKVAAHWRVPLKIRIGLHHGNAIGGVIGQSRPQFDCWGVAVNLASRLESSAGPGVVNLSDSAYEMLKEQLPECPSSEIELKGFGPTSVRVWTPMA